MTNYSLQQTDYRPHPALERDINAIIDHYLEQGSPDAADRVIRGIFKVLVSLQMHVTEDE